MLDRLWSADLRRVDGQGASRFGRGSGRPWGRVARVSVRSKVKRREWSNFGREQLLGAANSGGGGSREEFTTERGEERKSPPLHNPTPARVGHPRGLIK